jgi:hypothetical protein
MRSLHEVHAENALWAGRVSLSVCTNNSTREPLDGLGLNLVWMFCHSVLYQNRTFFFAAIIYNKITDKESRELDDNRLSEVLHSGGQSGNYGSSNMFNRYHGYQCLVNSLVNSSPAQIMVNGRISMKFVVTSVQKRLLCLH